MSNFTPDELHWGFRKETALRCGGLSGTQATPVALAADEVLMMDYLEGDLEIPEPQREREEFNPIGSGQNTAAVIEKGYKALEKDLELKMQTAIPLYYVMGSCTTGNGTQIPTNGTFTGFGTTTIVVTAAAGSYTYERNALKGISVKLVGATTVTTYIVSHAATTASTLTLVIAASAPATGANTCQFMSTDAGTDVMASGQGLSKITLTNLCTVAENGLVGKQIVINSIKYSIIANDAKSGAALVLYLNKNTAGTDDEETVTWYTFPFTHTISEAATTPSMVLYTERATIIKNHLGVLVKKVNIVVEKEGTAKCTASIMVGKTMTGTDQTTFPSQLSSDIFTWDMIARSGSNPFVFTYNGTQIETTVAGFLNECDKIDISIERDMEYLNVMGDEYPYKVKYGTRKYTIKLHFTPTAETLYNLKNTKLKDYAGNLALTVTLQRSTGDYVKLVFNSLYVSDYPDKLVTYEGKQVDVDVELKGAPAVGALSAGTLAITALDELDQRYYEADLATRTTA